MHDVDLEGSNFVASPSLSTPPLDASDGRASAAGGAGGAVPSDAALAALAASAATGEALEGKGDRPRSGAGARSMYLGSDGKF